MNDLATPTEGLKTPDIFLGLIGKRKHPNNEQPHTCILFNDPTVPLANPVRYCWSSFL